MRIHHSPQLRAASHLADLYGFDVMGGAVLVYRARALLPCQEGRDFGREDPEIEQQIRARHEEALPEMARKTAMGVDTLFR